MCSSLRKAVHSWRLSRSDGLAKVSFHYGVFLSSFRFLSLSLQCDMIDGHSFSSLSRSSGWSSLLGLSVPSLHVAVRHHRRVWLEQLQIWQREGVVSNRQVGGRTPNFGWPKRRLGFSDGIPSSFLEFRGRKESLEWLSCLFLVIRVHWRVQDVSIGTPR